MDNKEKSDVKFSERFSLKIRKTIIVSKIFTILVVLVLVAAFIGLNIWVNSIDLPEIDVTANQIYTLSDASKKALESIEQDVKIYIFGIDESNSVVGLIKQYSRANEKISYEILTRENNLEKVQEFELEDGYSIVVIEAGGSKKIIDASSEFHSYDYTTYEEVDTTEQTLTNSILSLSAENKPKIYFVEGHQEFGIAKEEGMQAELGVLSTYLRNEAFAIDTINLTVAGSVPEDCDVLAIMSPTTDFMENEAQAVIDYVNKGGNIFWTEDLLNVGITLPNLQKVLDLYGVTVENGYVIEADSNFIASGYPYVFRPQLSSYNKVTADIYSDSYVWLAYSRKLTFKPSEELEQLKVTHEELMGTTESAMFITDFSSDIATATANAITGKATTASLVTKTIVEGTLDENTGELKDNVASKLIIVANGRFITDYVVPEISSEYPMSYMGSNKDFAMNSIALLADKDTGLTLRKEMAGTSYMFTATQAQTRVVMVIVFSVPVLVILLGVVIWRFRKKRK